MQPVATLFHLPIASRRAAGRAALALTLLVTALAAALPARAQGLPSSARLNGIHHVYQEWNNCGPANLTMALSYFGWNSGQAAAQQYLKPDIEDKNVTPGEMAMYVNTQTELGVRAIWRYGGSVEILKEFIAAGFPVVAESGYDIEDLGWMGHYETVVAYDDEVQTLWVYDSYLGIGDGLGRTYTYDEFDSWWRHFNRTFLVLYPIDRELEVRDLLGSYVDPVYAAERALDKARAEAAQDPADSWAWFNAGTSAAKMERWHDSAIYFDEAFRQGLPRRMMWYQFEPYETYYRLGRYNDVIELANNTDATTEYVEETYYWRGLANAALGRTDEALADLDRAISFNPNFAAAHTAYDEVMNGAYVAPAAPVD